VQLSEDAERKLADQRMKEWSKDQEEHTEKQFQEIESRKKTIKPPEVISRKKQAEDYLESFRALTLRNYEKIEAELNCYPQDVIEEARTIFHQEKEEEKQRGIREFEEMEKARKIEARQRRKEHLIAQKEELAAAYKDSVEKYNQIAEQFNELPDPFEIREEIRSKKAIAWKSENPKQAYAEIKKLEEILIRREELQDQLRGADEDSEEEARKMKEHDRLIQEHDRLIHDAQ
jgi:hypothetical protein